MQQAASRIATNAGTAGILPDRAARDAGAETGAVCKLLDMVQPPKKFCGK
jgi:hypothetical protein